LFVTEVRPVTGVVQEILEFSEIGHERSSSER